MGTDESCKGSTGVSRSVDVVHTILQIEIFGTSLNKFGG